MMMINIDMAPLRSARTEVEFWAAFEDADRQARALPNGMLMLGTPALPYLILEGHGDEQHLVEWVDEAINTPLGPFRLGEVRRCIRRGQWVISLRDTSMQWRVLDDARDRRIAFNDPMLPNTELGLMPLSGLPSPLKVAA